MTHRELPKPLLLRIIEEDLDLLRGRRSDSTFEYVYFEPTETGRVTHGTKIDDGGKEKRLDRKQLRARHVFQVGIRVPKRRMIVARNQAVYVEKVVLDYRDEEGRQKFDEIAIAQTIRPGTEQLWDLPEVASDVVATVHARAFRKSANVELILVEARMIDKAGSPYFGAIQSAKLLEEAIRHGDIAATEIHAGGLAERMEKMHGAGTSQTGARPSKPAESRPIEPFPQADLEPPPSIEVFLELQRIEDLMTGTAEERREGLDRLHQLVRLLRPPTNR